MNGSMKRPHRNIAEFPAGTLLRVTVCLSLYHTVLLKKGSSEKFSVSLNTRIEIFFPQAPSCFFFF